MAERAWAPAKWRKVHADFVSSVKLRGIGSDARAILATMIAACWWDEESPEGRMYLGEGIPMMLEQLFAAAECPSRLARVAWRRLEELRIVGIVDGCPALLRFRAAQRADSTERTRRFRERSGNGSGTPVEHPRNQSEPSHVTEAEAEAEAEAELPPTPSMGVSSESPAEVEFLSRPTAEPKPKGKPTKPRADLPDGLAEHVLAELVRACRDLDGPAAGPRHNADHAPFVDALRKLHAAHSPTADEWTAVIHERLAMSKAGDTFGSLTSASLCVPGNFERWLAASRSRARGGSKPGRGAAPPSPRPTVAGIVDVASGRVTPVDLESVSDFLLESEAGT